MSAIQQTIDDIIQLEPLTKQYIEENLDDLIEEYVVNEIKSVSRAMNLPQHFIDGVKSRRVGPLHIKIINTWGTPEVPLAKFFNDGTIDHFIAPLGPWLLRWVTPLGNIAYSRGHMVRGIQKTEAMEIGIAIGMKRFQTAVLKNTKESVSKELETVE